MLSHYLTCVGNCGELVMGKEASSIESVVGFKRDPKEFGIRFHFELL
jgi:hypothetical protein